MRWQLLNPHERYAVTGQEPFDSIRVPAAITPGEQELAMHLTPIFCLECRHVDDTPHPTLAGVRAEQHRHELAGVETICLRPPPAAIHFDARGIDDAVGDSTAGQITMEPEPVAPLPSNCGPALWRPERNGYSRGRVPPRGS